MPSIVKWLLWALCSFLPKWLCKYSRQNPVHMPRTEHGPVGALLGLVCLKGDRLLSVASMAPQVAASVPFS